MTYKEHVADMKARFPGHEPMSEAHFDLMQEEAERSKLAEKNKREMPATLKNHIINRDKRVEKIPKPKAVKTLKEKKPPRQKKPPKEKKEPYRPQKMYTEQEIKERRKDALKKKREGYIALGLTIRGTPRVVKEKKEHSIEEIRARRVTYARNYREKNREKHLEYRKDYRERQKEVDREHRAKNLDAIRKYQKIWAREYRAKKRLQLLVKSGCAA